MSGIDVRIMIPNKPDHMFVYWATYSYVGQLLRAGPKSTFMKRALFMRKLLLLMTRHPLLEQRISMYEVSV